MAAAKPVKDQIKITSTRAKTLLSELPKADAEFIINGIVDEASDELITKLLEEVIARNSASLLERVIKKNK